LIPNADLKKEEKMRCKTFVENLGKPSHTCKINIERIRYEFWIATAPDRKGVDP